MGIFGRKPQLGAAVPSAAASAPTAAGASARSANLTKAAGVSLQKRPNVRRQWAVYIVSDMSGSMFMSGYMPDDVDFMTEAILIATRDGGWDADGKVPCVPMATRAAAPILVSLDDLGRVASRIEQHAKRNNIGAGTAYHNAVRIVREDYRASVDWGRHPAVVFCIVDGEDGNLGATIRELTDASRDPIHWVIVFFGRKDSSAASTARDLDSGRLLPNQQTDNVSVVWAGERPREIDPQRLFDDLLKGPSEWLDQAPRDGVRIPNG